MPKIKHEMGRKDLVRDAIETAIVDVLWDDNSPTLKLLTEALNAVPDLIDPEEFRVKLEGMVRAQHSDGNNPLPEYEYAETEGYNAAIDTIIQELKGDKDK